MMFRAASALTAVGIVLVVANWYARPEAALAWTAPLAMFAVMFAALRLSRRALRRSTRDATALRRIPTAVVFAALMIGHPAGADTRPLVRRRGRHRPRSPLDRSPHRRVPRDARECHAEESPTVVVDGMRRRTATGVSAARRLDVGALRSCVGDRLARAVDRLRGNCDDRVGGDSDGGDRRAAPAPSQAAQGRTRPWTELATQDGDLHGRGLRYRPSARNFCRVLDFFGTGTGFCERLEPEFPRNCSLIHARRVDRTKRRTTQSGSPAALPPRPSGYSTLTKAAVVNRRRPGAKIGLAAAAMIWRTAGADIESSRTRNIRRRRAVRRGQPFPDRTLVTRPRNLRQPSVIVNQDIAGDAARIGPRPCTVCAVNCDQPTTGVHQSPQNAHRGRGRHQSSGWNACANTWSAICLDWRRATSSANRKWIPSRIRPSTASSARAEKR